ncbi:hypothetical protein [Flavobacterium sp. 3HN19-14]|uniref:hypothetical protein n=1 Tax=Flavobacterium sp. 3HN19-14 TaxID=3448133 RepID=UPI003EE3B47A
MKTGREYLNNILYNRKMALVLAFLLIVYHLVRLVYFIRNNDVDMVLRQSIWK